MSDGSSEPEQMGTAPIRLESPVTTVIRQHPRPDAVECYESWLQEIVPVAQQFTGHHGMSVIRPHGKSDGYTIVLHFDTMVHLRRWLDSDIRLSLVEKIRPYLRSPEDIDITTGLEFWFTPPPGGKPAKPYKQFLVTLSAIFPLSLVIPRLLAPVFAHLPVLAWSGPRQLVIVAVMVALMTYVVMPGCTVIDTKHADGQAKHQTIIVAVDPPECG